MLLQRDYKYYWIDDIIFTPLLYYLYIKLGAPARLLTMRRATGVDS